MYPLGPIEKVMHAVYERFDGDGMMAAALRVKGVIEDKPLQQALRLLERRHPKLRSRFVLNERAEPCLEVLQRMPITAVRAKEFQTDNPPWSEEALRAVGDKIDAWKGPLWRVELLRSRKHGVCDLLLVHHHGILDGGSTFRLLHDLLTYYQALVEPHGGEATGEHDIQPLPVILTSELPVVSSLPNRLLLVLQLAGQQIWKRRGAWTSLPSSESPDDPPHWSRLVLPKDESQALLERCRREQTTMGGTLFAAALSSLARTVQAPQPRFRCGLAISIREMGPEPVSAEHLGCFVSRYENVYRVNPSHSMWDVARRAHHMVARFLNRQGPALTTRLAKYFKPLEPRRKRATLGFSNVGIVDLRESYGPVTPQAFGVVARNRHVGPSLNLQSVTINGKLSIIHGAINVSGKFLEDYHKTFRLLLQQAIQRGGQGDDQK